MKITKIGTVKKGTKPTMKSMPKPKGTKMKIMTNMRRKG